MLRDGTIRRNGGTSSYQPMQPNMPHTRKGFGNKFDAHMQAKGRKPLEPKLIEALNQSGVDAAIYLKENKKIIGENIQLGMAWFQAWGRATGPERRRIFGLGPLRYAKERGNYPEGRTAKEDAELVRTCRATVQDMLKGSHAKNIQPKSEQVEGQP